VPAAEDQNITISSYSGNSSLRGTLNANFRLPRLRSSGSSSHHETDEEVKSEPLSE
jgi:hypothetical protein